MERCVILAVCGFLVQVIIPGSKRYFYIRAGLSRPDLFDTITGRNFNL